MSSSHGAADGRTSSFSRNMGLEALLKDINSSLWGAEQKILENHREAEYPLILMMGPHRSGTTLLMQWLANTGLVAYPTNLLSRFYQAPIIGAKIQLLLTDPRFNFRDELGEFVQQAEYKSENGKTKGVLAPNEFWYFWRRFLAEPGRDAWTDEELKLSMDARTMCAELAGMMDVFQKPFAAKGMLFNYNIPFLDSVFDKVLFVQIKRDPATNVASVLEARKRQLGNEAAWYSFKIPEYDELKGLDPVIQTAGQIYYINRAVDRGLAAVDESRKLVVHYEDFCADPARVFEEIRLKLALPQDGLYRGPNCFVPSRKPEGSLAVTVEQTLRVFDSRRPDSTDFPFTN
jgi:hypothetical protein